MKFRITSNGAYLYHRRFTLSFTWRCRWTWLPELQRWALADGGWNLWWGWCALELLRWREGDDWGEEAGESMADTFEWLLGETEEACDDVLVGRQSKTRE
jgi:hypothetical protein